MQASAAEAPARAVDEAAQLGRVGSFVRAMTLMRGYSLKIWTFWQAASQLEIYGPHARTIIDNAGVVQVFGLRNRRAASETAALLGGISADALMAMRPDEQALMVDGAQVLAEVRRLRLKTPGEAVALIHADRDGR